MSTRGISVVIPAHNEAAVIGRCLSSIQAGARARSVEIVVVCNGCTDETAAIARRVAPRALVIETDVPAKHNALNLGDAAASEFPRCYMDADVVISPGALDQIGDVLDGNGIMAAAPRPLFDLSRSGPGARLFLQLWQHAPYFTDDLLGSGFYALSATGRERFEAFPPVVADDFFIASTFAAQERKGVDGCTFTPLLPVTLSGIVDIHIRHYAAHHELARWLAASGRQAELRLDRPSSGAWIAPFLARPRWWANVLVYIGVKIAAKVGGQYKHRYGTMTWNRDQAGRDSVARQDGPSGYRS